MFLRVLTVFHILLEMCGSDLRLCWIHQKAMFFLLACCPLLSCCWFLHCFGSPFLTLKLVEDFVLFGNAPNVYKFAKFHKDIAVPLFFSMCKHYPCCFLIYLCYSSDISQTDSKRQTEICFKPHKIGFFHHTDTAIWKL